MASCFIKKIELTRTLEAQEVRYKNKSMYIFFVGYRATLE